MSMSRRREKQCGAEVSIIDNIKGYSSGFLDGTCFSSGVSVLGDYKLLLCLRYTMIKVV